ncbi:MAG: FAD-dependent oxidoreductase [Rhizobiales bacterium]|nr:FAD-dependent oxidoreductase [Hyphomicrobiales bacterium]
MTALNIAVVGAGVAGLSAAWLLSKQHRVVVFEAGNTVGGHSNTIDVIDADEVHGVDTGFIVYNPPNYPNLCALFDHLEVATKVAPMTFSVSLDDGAYEYSGTRVGGLFGQPSTLFSLDHWRMLKDVLRFFKNAPSDAQRLPLECTLGTYLAQEGYSTSFIRKHLAPMAGAIWSTPIDAMMDYPVRAFVSFFQNHGLLQVSNRPQWRTVEGGSRSYVDRILQDGTFEVRLATPVRSVSRGSGGVSITDNSGEVCTFDHVVLATHADQSLQVLHDADRQEIDLLQAFRYTENLAVVHSDPTLMPKRKSLWSSWNYIGRDDTSGALTVSYWMNALQTLAMKRDVFVTLNPPAGCDVRQEIARFTYQHPVFDVDALRAQADLWSLQRRANTWFCGSYFGAGFHEDALQSGLAVAEDLGSVRRPWRVEGESSRIKRRPAPTPVREAAE